MTRSINPREGRTWPAYILGGRLRTTTVILVIAFCAIWWLYETYQPDPAPPPQVPASEVVPPGFIPDPNYTWAPRTNVQQPSTTPTTPPSAAPSASAEPGAPTTSAAPAEPGVPPNQGAPRPPAGTPEPSAPASAPEPEKPAAMPQVPGVDAATAPAAPAR